MKKFSVLSATAPMTAAPSPQDFYTLFERQAKEGLDILCICSSSRLSSSLQSALIAKEMLKETHPNIRAEVLNSLNGVIDLLLYVIAVPFTDGAAKLAGG